MAAFEEIDVHGLTRQQAIVAIDAKLRRCKGDVFRLRVIHGYHGGTELRDLVRREIAKDPKVLRYEIGLNQGETELVLRGLF
jgi:DNA-nicking Smr family endonuclease